MDFKKKTIILVSILAVLVVTYTLGTIFSPASIRERRREQRLFPQASVEDASEIVINKSDSTITLKKDNEKWFLSIGGSLYPAIQGGTEDLVKTAVKQNQFRIVTKSKDKWDQFEVTEEKAERLTIKDSKGNNLVDILIGKQGLEESGNYLRLPKNNEVYFVDTPFTSYINRDIDYWSYLKFFDEKPDVNTVEQLSCKADIAITKDTSVDSDYTLIAQAEQNKPIQWKVKGQDLSIKNEKVTALLNTITSLTGNTFAVGATKDETGLDNPKAIISFTQNNGDTVSISVGKETGEERFFVHNSSNGIIYKVSAWKLKNIIKPLNSLIAENKPE